jgi:biopolymer transport protein ExbB
LLRFALGLGMALGLGVAAAHAQDGSAQAAAAQETMSRLATSAEEELQSSILELDSLRQRIAAEKLPLAQELTALEERLTELRREQIRVTRLVDEGSLEIAGIRSATKARRDELDYATNLLDEYARNFETRVNVSELQYCGEAIATAKNALENEALSLDEKLERQTALARLSLQRIFDALGGVRFAGVGVDLQGTLARGQFALVGPVALFRAGGGVAGLVVPQSGSSNPLIRPLEGKLQASLAALVETGEGLLPLDPSRGGALQALVQKTSLIHLFEKGGPIMWPLLVASILALGAVLERVFFLVNERRKRDPAALNRLYTEVERGDLEGALRATQDSQDFVVRVLRYALAHREQSLSSALIYAQAQELKRFRRGISILDTVITLAPLLGLLGTVTGMMSSFSLIGGELSAPGAITGGIAEALIATAFGLGIAIVALLPFNVLNTKMDEATHEIESASTQLELLIQKPETRPEREKLIPRPAASPTPALV